MIKTNTQNPKYKKKLFENIFHFIELDTNIFDLNNRSKIAGISFLRSIVIHLHDLVQQEIINDPELEKTSGL